MKHLKFAMKYLWIWMLTVVFFIVVDIICAKLFNWSEINPLYYNEALAGFVVLLIAISEKKK